MYYSYSYQDPWLRKAAVQHLNLLLDETVETLYRQTWPDVPPGAPGLAKKLLANGALGPFQDSRRYARS